MTKKDLYAHPGWKWCTFEGAREHVLLMGLESTFREKLEWLEETETLTLRMRAGQKQSDGGTQSADRKGRGAGLIPNTDSDSQPIS